ncbi:TPA: hypothetical protein ACP62B_004564, partial [Escherichia coli]
LLAGREPEDSGRQALLQQVLSRENMVGAWKRVRTNKESAGVDGLTIGKQSGTSGPAVAHSVGVSERNVSAAGSASRGNFKTDRWYPGVRYSDSQQKVHPASIAASPATVDRPDILSVQLWLPTGQKRAPDVRRAQRYAQKGFRVGGS